MSANLMIRGGTVVGSYDARTCDLLVADGEIREKKEKVYDYPDDYDVYDASGMWIFPGFVDLRWFGQEASSEWSNESIGMLAAGITSVALTQEGVNESSSDGTLLPMGLTIYQDFKIHFKYNGLDKLAIIDRGFIKPGTFVVFPDSYFENMPLVEQHWPLFHGKSLPPVAIVREKNTGSGMTNAARFFTLKGIPLYLHKAAPGYRSGRIENGVFVPEVASAGTRQIAVSCCLHDLFGSIQRNMPGTSSGTAMDRKRLRYQNVAFTTIDLSILAGRTSLWKKDPTMITRCCADFPAKIAGLFPRKGRIAIGADADIVVVDPETLTVKDVFQRGRLVIRDGIAVSMPTTPGRKLAGTLPLCFSLTY